MHKGIIEILKYYSLNFLIKHWDMIGATGGQNCRGSCNVKQKRIFDQSVCLSMYLMYNNDIAHLETSSSNRKIEM